MLLTACSGVPLPERCREVGVSLAGNDTVTGVIVEEHTGTLEEVSIACRSPFKPKYGCPIPVSEHEYDIWYVDIPEVRDHERCHALYEEWNHTE